MAIGDRHTFADGYTFVETLHGPNVEGTCADGCGTTVYATPENIATQLCSACGRRRHGCVASVKSALDPSARMGQGGVNCYPQGRPRQEG